jgi:hypothetical protein
VRIFVYALNQLLFTLHSRTGHPTKEQAMPSGILRKLGFADRTQAAVHAARYGWDEI